MPRSVDAVSRLLLGRVYSIGLLTGPSPLSLGAPPGVTNPILSRESLAGTFATFVADPFMLRVAGEWHLFFEALTWRPGSKKGEIAHATSRDGRRWDYQGIVLSEPFHLSYPYVFEHRSQHYMIPESTAAAAVRLYRADPFPRRWLLVKELLSGPVHLDNSVFFRDDAWWMFTATDPARGTLRLFRSTELTGPWTEHPRSPVVAANRRISRPAGRVISVNGRLIRFAQDCRETYGSGVHALEITRLTSRDYEEVELSPEPILAGSGSGWNGRGMHHVDAHQLEDGSWIACVDGWSLRIRRPREVARWVADRLA